MADLGTIVSGVTRMPTSWLQDVNDVTYRNVRLGGEYLLEKAYVSTDLGKWDNAFARLLAKPECHSIKIGGVDQEVFNLSNTVSVNRGKVTIFCDAFRGVTLNLEGSDPYLFDFGDTTSVKYDVALKNFVFTRTNSATSGAVMRFRNIVYFNVDDTRSFMDNKFWRWLELTSCFQGRFMKNFSEQPIREHAYINGGASSGGTLDGNCVQNYFILHEAIGGHAATPGAAEDMAGFLFDDYCQANMVHTLRHYSHKGFAVHCKGSSASKPSNVLNLFYDLNVEAGTDAGTIRLDYYASSQIQLGWSSGNVLPAVRFGADSSANRVAGMQLGLSAAGCYGVQDRGVQNTIENCDFVLYNAGPSGIELASSVSGPVVKNCTFRGLVYGVVNNAPTNTNMVISGLRSISLSGTILQNFGAASTAKVSDIAVIDGTQYSIAASTVNLFLGYPIYYISGTTAINNIGVTYAGQEVTIQLTDIGGTINDAAVSGGNIKLLVASSTFTSPAGRSVISFVFDGSFWVEVSRNG